MDFLAYVYRPKVTFDDYGGLIDYLIGSNFCVIPSRSFQQFNSFAGKLNEVLKDSTCFIYRTTYTHENDDSTHTSILIFRFEFYLNDPNVDGDISTLTNIFRYAGINLTNIRRFFEGTSVSGTIPSDLIAENTMLKNINKLF